MTKLDPIPTLSRRSTEEEEEEDREKDSEEEEEEETRDPRVLSREDRDATREATMKTATMSI